MYFQDFVPQLIISLAILAVDLPTVNAQFESLTINTSFEYPHECIRACVYGGRDDGIEKALKCATPVANQCYCATASASATLIQSYVTACASLSCSRGDFTQDVQAIKSAYASYCLEAGYTAPIVSEWYTARNTTIPSPSTTFTAASRTASGLFTPSATSPSATVVQTITTSGGALTNSMPLTSSPQSTDSAALPVSHSNSNHSSSKKALGIGLGIGIASILAGIVFSIWYCRRRRRKQRTLDEPPEVFDPSKSSPIDEVSRISPTTTVVTPSQPLASAETLTTPQIFDISQHFASPQTPEAPGMIASHNQRASVVHELGTDGPTSELDGVEILPPQHEWDQKNALDVQTGQPARREARWEEVHPPLRVDWQNAVLPAYQLQRGRPSK